MEHSIEKVYNKEKKKHNLPDFNKLDFEFEISIIDDGVFIIREVRRKMSEKIETFTKLLEDVLQPETTVADLHECNFFGEEEKEKIFKLYSKLMRINRKSLCLGLNPDDKKEAEFINNVFGEWENIKKDITHVLRKMKEAWEKEAETKENPQYFG